MKCYSGAAQEVTSGPFRDISDYYYQNAVTGECGGGSCPITNKGINKEYLELMGYYPSNSYCVERQVHAVYRWCLLIFHCLGSTMKKKVAQSSLVHIYFKNLGIVKYSKDSLYGWADLIGKL